MALKKLSRDALNEAALKAGIADPKELPNKAAVIAAIEEAQEAPPVDPDLFAVGARVISVFGSKESRALIEIPTKLAVKLFKEPLEASGRTGAIDAVERDLERIAKSEPELAESTLAAVAVRMAYELEHPYNSATSKSMCAKALKDVSDRIRELAPEEEKEDVVAGLKARRDARRAKA